MVEEVGTTTEGDLIINVGPQGTVTLDGEKHVLDKTDGLYVGLGVKEIVFSSTDSKNPARGIRVEKAKQTRLVPQPWTAENTPISLRAKGRKIPAWTLDRLNMVPKLQPSPVRSAEPVEELTLIPMGAARLRVSMFPVIGNHDDGWGDGHLPGVCLGEQLRRQCGV